MLQKLLFVFIFSMLQVALMLFEDHCLVTPLSALQRAETGHGFLYNIIDLYFIHRSVRSRRGGSTSTVMKAVEQEQTPSTSSASGSPQLMKRHVLRPGDVRNVGAAVQEATVGENVESILRNWKAGDNVVVYWYLKHHWPLRAVL